MFEFEADHAIASAESLPANAGALFFQGEAEALALLPWEEHCTECAMPQCYGTCDLYEPRNDGKCRRFHKGFEYISLSTAAAPIARVSFKRWGTVLAYGNLRLVPRSRAQRLTAWIDWFANQVGRLPDGRLSIAGRRAPMTRLMRRLKRRIISRSTPLGQTSSAKPTAFVLEVLNPQSSTINASFVIRDEGTLRTQPFQQLLAIAPGFNRINIPFDQIAGHIDDSKSFTISVCPNLLRPEDEGVALYFGMMTFVSSAAPRAVLANTYRQGPLPDGVKHVKAVAWDLDNTVWKGILLEDGEAGLSLRPQIIDVMRELDRRGIINSIVSKNDAEVVMPLLQRFGIADYVVFPNIGWTPKSESVLNLVKRLNIGADTLVVVDDSPFEREEISSRCTGVRVLPETDYLQLLSRPEFCPPLSAESSKRRAFYRAEEQRNAVAVGNNGSYADFLRECQMTMQVRRVNADNVDRVHELIQRTNQLNFSGNRYTREQVRAFLRRDDLLPLSIACQDRFGDYGLIGFCLYNHGTGTIDDLMFSCRVQAKTVEHTFLRRLALSLRERGVDVLKAVYKKTPKNTQTARVFSDLGFQLLSSDESGVSFVYGIDLETIAPTQEFISVDWDLSSCSS